MYQYVPVYTSMYLTRLNNSLTYTSMCWYVLISCASTRCTGMYQMLWCMCSDSAPCLHGQQRCSSRQPGNFAVETMKPCVETESNLSKVLYRPVHTSTYWFILVHTCTYHDTVQESTCQYILVHTSTQHLAGLFACQLDCLLAGQLAAMIWYNRVHVSIHNIMERHAIV